MREGWTYRKLGEIAFYPNQRVSISRLNMGDYVGVENLIKNRGGVIFGADQPSIDSAIAYQIGDILIGNIRPYLRKIWLADKNGGASGDIVLVRVRDEWVDKIRPYYLFKALSTDLFFEYDNANTKGAKMPRGDRNAIANYTIPIPPLPEQERIVAELDLLTGIIDKQKQQVKELDTLAQSIFYDMFGDPVENEKGWEKGCISGLCCPKKEILRASKSFSSSDVIEYIDISSIDNKKNIMTSTSSVVFSDAPSRAQQVVIKDDILVSLVRPNLKNVAVVNQDDNNLVASSGFCVLRHLPSISYEFLFYITKSEAFTEYLMQRVSGANYPAVREDDIKDYPTIVPPIELQELFAQKIQSIESQKDSINCSIAETQKLFDYTMDKYFG